MVGLINRTRRLRTLFAIRVGPGAAILPPHVKQIDMNFALDTRRGHRGAKNFWRTYLTRLKYYNPTVPMTVNRSEDKKAPALMTLHFAGPAADDPQAPPKEWTETIDMRDRDESSILAQLLERTNAQPVKTSPEDKELGQQLAEQEAEVVRVRAVIQAMRAKKKEEEARFLQARGEAEALRGEI